MIPEIKDEIIGDYKIQPHLLPQPQKQSKKTTKKTKQTTYKQEQLDISLPTEKHQMKDFKEMNEVNDNSALLMKENPTNNLEENKEQKEKRQYTKRKTTKQKTKHDKLPERADIPVPHPPQPFPFVSNDQIKEEVEEHINENIENNNNNMIINNNNNNNNDKIQNDEDSETEIESETEELTPNEQMQQNNAISSEEIQVEQPTTRRYKTKTRRRIVNVEFLGDDWDEIEVKEKRKRKSSTKKTNKRRKDPSHQDEDDIDNFVIEEPRRTRSRKLRSMKEEDD